MLVAAKPADTFAEWRTQAREFLSSGIAPDEIAWTDSQSSQQALFASAAAPKASTTTVALPKAFVQLAEMVARHSDPRRWSVLYRTAWRISHGERQLLHIDIDDDIALLHAMRKAVEHDSYKMRAFVRFRRVETEEGEQFVAWYEPQYDTLETNAKFFVDRFGSMRWAILTPHKSLVWDLQQLHNAPGVPRSQAPAEDELEDLWRLYYKTTFNPARLNLTAMRAQMPVFRWVDLPETRVIPELVRMSRGRVEKMAQEQRHSAAGWIPDSQNLVVLEQAVQACGACGLCARASGPVWGAGNPQAQIMLVGEQPGDEEDRQRRPFVGPAGEVLDAALDKAGLSRGDLYVTNAVKAFKFEERGKRRIHQTPRPGDIETCRPWLMAEIEAVRPKTILCLGASAAQSVYGRKVQIGAERGRLTQQPSGLRLGVTYHPAAILRSQDAMLGEQMMSMLVDDLRLLKTA